MQPPLAGLDPFVCPQCDVRFGAAPASSLSCGHTLCGECAAAVVAAAPARCTLCNDPVAPQCHLNQVLVGGGSPAAVKAGASRDAARAALFQYMSLAAQRAALRADRHRSVVLANMAKAEARIAVTAAQLKLQVDEASRAATASVQTHGALLCKHLCAVQDELLVRASQLGAGAAACRAPASAEQAETSMAAFDALAARAMYDGDTACLENFCHPFVNDVRARKRVAGA